jgi:hypothetical protein
MSSNCHTSLLTVLDTECRRLSSVLSLGIAQDGYRYAATGAARPALLPRRQPGASLIRRRGTTDGLEYQKYLSLREQANEDWQRLARITEQVAEQFMADVPHGGDLDALKVTFISATQKTRDTMAQYRAWLVKQQGDSS